MFILQLSDMLALRRISPELRMSQPFLNGPLSGYEEIEASDTEMAVDPPQEEKPKPDSAGGAV